MAHRQLSQIRPRPQSRMADKANLRQPVVLMVLWGTRNNVSNNCENLGHRPAENRLIGNHS